MKCPRCSQSIHRGATRCPHCDFDWRTAQSLWTRNDITRRPLLDLAGIFRREEVQWLENRLEKLHQRFPQLSFSLITDIEGVGLSLSEQAFLWLNQVSEKNTEEAQALPGGMILLIDPEKKRASFSYGYLWEPYLKELQLFDALIFSHSYWLERMYFRGSQRFIKQLEKQLIQRHRVAPKLARRFQEMLSSKKESK